jgi:hypothetical protein
MPRPTTSLRGSSRAWWPTGPSRIHCGWSPPWAPIRRCPRRSGGGRRARRHLRGASGGLRLRGMGHGQRTSDERCVPRAHRNVYGAHDADSAQAAAVTRACDRLDLLPSAARAQRPQACFSLQRTEGRRCRKPIEVVGKLVAAVISIAVPIRARSVGPVVTRQRSVARARVGADRADSRVFNRRGPPSPGAT